jgi:hypothetical protein
MDDIVLLIALLLGLRAVVARLVPLDVPFGWPLGAESRDAFWRMTLPWPRGVQEDVEIAWHVPRPASPVDVEQRPTAPRRPVPPTRPQPRFIGR